MRSEPRPERLKLIIEPEAGDTVGDGGATREPNLDREPGRRYDSAGTESDPMDYGVETPRRRVFPAIMALFALAAFAGIIWYAYNWGLGQVETARLPVILAEPGAIKVRPESPGGLEVPYRDKLVLNDLTPDPDKPQVERLLPPPEVPLPPKAPSAAEPKVAELPIETGAGPSGERAESAAPPPPPVLEEPPGGDTVATTPQIAAGVPIRPAAPAPEATPEPAPEAVPARPQVTAQAPAAELPVIVPPAVEPPAVALPSIEAPEEAKPAVSALPAPSPDVAAPKAPQPQTAALTPSGSYVVQLASLKARDGTAPAWARLKKAHPKLLGNKELTVQRIDLGGRGVFYRVQAGFFSDRASANALCRALKARRQDCLVLKR